MKKFLVSGSVKMDISYSYEEQRSFNKEGIWDTMSEEVCMIGCRVDSLKANPDFRILPSSSCNWKLCMTSVLRRYVSIDSPEEGAVLSSLYADAHHPCQLTPLWFLQAYAHHFPGPYPDVKEMVRIASLTTYQYTVIAEAEELAKTTSPVLDKRWFYPHFPNFDVEGFCKANMAAIVSRFGGNRLYNIAAKSRPLHSVSLDGFQITYLESCSVRYKFDDLTWNTPLESPAAPGTYLKVAVQLNIVRMRRKYGHPSTPWQCSAEGVYEAFTRTMHLVVYLRPRYAFDGVRNDQLVAAPWPLRRNRAAGGDAQVENHEIYMKLQFPSINMTMSSADLEKLDPGPESHHGEYYHRYMVNLRLESLRSNSDMLCSGPLVAKTFPLYKPS